MAASDPAAMARRSRAVVETAMAARYLGQLCQHFRHKIPVTRNDAAGRIEFPFGACALFATEGTLTLTAEAADAEALGRLQEVIGRHLLRFAFREALTVAWRAA